MSKREIYIVTHGEKETGENPSMTAKGRQEIASLAHLLPSDPDRVYCGTGRRNIEMAGILGLLATNFTPVIGGPESLEMMGGKPFIVLADGRKIPQEDYSGTDDGREGMLSLVETLLKGVYSDERSGKIIMLAGRPAMIMYGYPRAKSGAVYRINANGTVEELGATGTVEASTKEA